ncbi:MAG: polyamine aminopropyltransferase [Candidatus Aenigmarchaeota archaeon]|nr:polyamine aminopropyltransferase [Candidatus Aenigmarchaeota archaeon]MDW8149202.1 polyamine aminopropyltransferase [Candidatus Aenigmarchaeota archaeon]
MYPFSKRYLNLIIKIYENMRPDITKITKLPIGIEKGIEKKILEKNTKYQHVIIARLYFYGLSLILDNLLQFTEKDEFIYHETLVHPPLLLHPNPSKVLIIGGGDGCAAREVLKHKIDLVKIVDIDEEIINLCKIYFKKINKNSLINKKVEIIVEDGKFFVEKEKEKYDCIILDLTDPFGSEISKELYSKKFYKNLKNLLNKDGIIVTQAGSAFYFKKIYNSIYKSIQTNFKFIKDYENWIPSFGYSCCFIVASNKYNLSNLTENEIKKRIKERKLKLKFYTPSIHMSLMKKGITKY